MERLSEQWNKRNINEDEIIKIMRKSSLDSNRSFAKKIFPIARCGEFFEVEKAALTKDGDNVCKTSRKVSR